MQIRQLYDTIHIALFIFTLQASGLMTEDHSNPNRLVRSAKWSPPDSATQAMRLQRETDFLKYVLLVLRMSICVRVQLKNMFSIVYDPCSMSHIIHGSHHPRVTSSSGHIILGSHHPSAHSLLFIVTHIYDVTKQTNSFRCTSLVVIYNGS